MRLSTFSTIVALCAITAISNVCATKNGPAKNDENIESLKQDLASMFYGAMPGHVVSMGGAEAQRHDYKVGLKQFTEYLKVTIQSAASVGELISSTRSLDEKVKVLEEGNKKQGKSIEDMKKDNDSLKISVASLKKDLEEFRASSIAQSAKMQEELLKKKK